MENEIMLVLLDSPPVLYKGLVDMVKSRQRTFLEKPQTPLQIELIKAASGQASASDALCFKEC